MNNEKKIEILSEIYEEITTKDLMKMWIKVTDDGCFVYEENGCIFYKEEGMNDEDDKISLYSREDILLDIYEIMILKLE